jgi:hydrogenase small subunit
VEEVHILWIFEGMSCDGDSISVTAATLPSIEDVLLGNIPGLPTVHLHNKVVGRAGPASVAPGAEGK